MYDCRPCVYVRMADPDASSVDSSPSDSSSSSDNGTSASEEGLEASFEGAVEPYMYEPVASEGSSGEESEEQSQDDQRLLNTDW